MGAGDSYDVTLSQISDQVLWRILYRGYMGSSYRDWGLECDDDLYYATKTAVHSMAEGISPNDKYEVAVRVGKFDQSLSLEEVQRRSRKVLDVAQQLYNYGYNGSENYMKATLTINEQGDLVEQTINGSEYVVQNYSVTSNKELSSYKVSISGFPEGTKIFNNSNNETQQMTSSNFKIAILKSNIQNDIDGYINITEAQVKTYPVFYADSLNENTQNYVTFADPSESSSASKKANISTDKSTLKIIKKDSENNRPIGGVTFAIKYSDGTNIGEYTTDDLGIIQIDNLRIGDITIQEISAPEFYIIDSTIINETLEFNSITTVNLTNEHKKGNLKVHKIDADTNKSLEGIKFELYAKNVDAPYKENELIGTYVTDSDGKIEIDNLWAGEYYLKEIETDIYHKLNTKEIVVKIKHDETAGLTVKNELKKGRVKVVKIDKDNNEVKLEGVTFEILNKDMKVVEEIITDENGEAISKKLPCVNEKYFVREKETKESYVLSNEIRRVVLEEDKITNLTFENEKIKGYIKVIKTSLDDNPITGDTAGTPIPNITFNVYDSEENIVDVLTTDSEGMAISDLLVYGQYIVKEESEGKYWQLNTNEYIVDINENLVTIDVNITNESDKPSVDVEKTGIIQTTSNQEIRYDFHIKNTGNTNLNNFTWFDYLPSDYVRMSKLITGTYNQDLNYSIYYKTNLNDYKLLVENLNTQVNNYVDFSKIQLEEGEVITEFRADFGIVDVGFESIVDPSIFVITNDGLEDDTTFTNRTRIEGSHESYLVWDEDDHTTKVYKKEIEVKRLPRTGF